MERRALEMDPLSIINATEYGRLLVLSGQTDEGLKIMKKHYLGGVQRPI